MLLSNIENLREMMTNKEAQLALQDAERHCSERGAKFTAKRKRVLEALLNSDKALSAYELADYCRVEQGLEMLPMSIYRILDFLASEGLVHRLKTTNKFIACSHISCNHDHQAWQFLICQSCDKVEEVDLEKSIVSKITDAIHEVGFRMAGSQLELEGVCADCSMPEGARL